MQRLQDFHSLFEQRIYERGEAYFDSGRVGPVEQLAPGLWHAVVRGTDDYQVDVRLRNGAVISAACSCPYGQRSTYCKHVAALLLAMRAKLEGRERPGDKTGFPNDASNAVDWYVMNEFPNHRRLGDNEWRAIRHILQRLYAFPDLDKPLLRAGLLLDKSGREKWDARGQYGDAPHPSFREREIARLESHLGPKTRTLAQERMAFDRTHTKFWKIGDNEDTLVNMRILVPSIGFTHLDQLQHTWMTILEAAYEHLKDRDGLRRLYQYYIITAQTEPESVYVRKLRELSGPDWAADRDEIVRLRKQHIGFRLNSPLNPAYERLLREERLSDAALDYCRWDDDLLFRMLDVIADDPGNAAETDTTIHNIMLDPDSVIYAKDNDEYADHAALWIRRYDTVYGYGKAAGLAREIVGIFPRRTALRDRLREYLPQLGDEAPQPVTDPAETAETEEGPGADGRIDDPDGADSERSTEAQDATGREEPTEGGHDDDGQ